MIKGMQDPPDLLAEAQRWREQSEQTEQQTEEN